MKLWGTFRTSAPSTWLLSDVVTEFLDGSIDGERSFQDRFRRRQSPAGYTADAGQLILNPARAVRERSTNCRRVSNPKIVEAMNRLGIDAAHIEGTYVAWRAL